MRFKIWNFSIIIYYWILQPCFMTTGSAKSHRKCIENVVEGSRIIGGYVCKKHPSHLNTQFVIALTLYNGIHVCGGSLISSSLVLSAAHCYDPEGTLYATDAVTRDSWVNSDGVLHWFTPVIKVKKAFVHQGYDKDALLNDIVIFQLQKPMKNVKFVTLPKPTEGDVSEICDKGRVLGWGTTKRYDYSTPVRLMCADLKIIPNDRCSFPIPDSQTCTEASMTDDSCYGDSGGPLMCGGVQYGITSWGINCAEGFPGFYTRVDKFLSFIETVIKSKGFRIHSNNLWMFLLFGLVFYIII